jgi:hypothetical protein
MIGCDEYVSACAWRERRRDAHDIEPHRAASRELGRPLGQPPSNQRMQVIDLRCHASRGPERPCGPLLSVANASEMTMPYPVWGNQPIATVTFAVPHIHLTGRRATSQLSVKRPNASPRCRTCHAWRGGYTVVAMPTERTCVSTGRGADRAESVCAGSTREQPERHYYGGCGRTGSIERQPARRGV